MSVKIRLTRHGKKGFAFYHIVVADGRAPRDGRYIERLGVYNPNTNPATVDFDFDRALDWLQKGAQPTESSCLKARVSPGLPHLLPQIHRVGSTVYTLLWWIVPDFPKAVLVCPGK